MENFVVSARKYRPVTFESVVGQGHITTTLKNAIKNNHLAQAFLFCGPRGVGKTTCARILAKTINCTNLTPDFEACGQCESCTSFKNNASFNIHELDAASNNSVDDIRNLVDQVRYPPQHGKYKVYIIDEVHMLSNQAFNAFLKTLEEPPSYAIFILATTEKNKIIPTILSRCQIFDFNRIQLKDISDHLARIAEKESIQTEDEALRIIAQKADGGLRDALSLFDRMVTFSLGSTLSYKTVIENLHILDYDYFFKITGQLYESRLSDALLILDEILRNGFDPHNFLVGLMEHIRNLLVCKDSSTVQLLPVSESVKNKYLEQANSTSLSFIVSALNILNQADLHYRQSKNPRLHMELALMKVSYLKSALSVSQALLETGEPKKKIDVNPKEEIKTSIVPGKEPVSSPVLSSAVNVSLPSVPVLPSFKDIKPETIKEVGQEQKQETPQINNQSRKVSNDELGRLVQQYAELKKAEDRMMDFVIFNERQIITEANKIIIKIDNEVQQQQLQQMRFGLIDFLREHTGNNYAIESEILKSAEQKKRLYTSSDKYQFLVEKYPALEELKRKLGLEIDF